MTSALHAEGREFNPRPEYFAVFWSMLPFVVLCFRFYLSSDGPQKGHSFVGALVAQWIEHQTSNLGVAGSSPAKGILFFKNISHNHCFLLWLWYSRSVQVWPSG